MAKRLDRLEKSQTPKKPKTKEKAAKKEKKGTVSETVLDIIRKNRSKSGIGMITLKKKTGFDNKAILNAIFPMSSIA